MLVNNGFGMAINLDLFDRAVNIQTPYLGASIEVFTGPGTFWHFILGAVAGLLPFGLPVAASLAFAGYEVSKLEAGEPGSIVGGSIIEYAIGLLIAAGIRSVL